MIVTEHRLTFARAGDAWRCVERPELLMVRSGSYRIEGSEQELPTMAAVLADDLKSSEGPPNPGAARPARG